MLAPLLLSNANRHRGGDDRIRRHVPRETKPEWVIQREHEQSISATVASIIEAKARSKGRKLLAAEIIAILDELGEL